MSLRDYLALITFSDTVRHSAATVPIHKLPSANELRRYWLYCWSRNGAQLWGVRLANCVDAYDELI